MARRFLELPVSELFKVKSGDFHAANELDVGDIPLVSCGNANNGVIGHFDIPDDKVYSHCITTAYNGQPLTTKFHPYRFAAKDDVAVLLPRTGLQASTLLYIAARLNWDQWRYSYGRKCYHAKMRWVTVRIPVLENNGAMTIDEDYIAEAFPADHAKLIPDKTHSGLIQVRQMNWRQFSILELFNVARGDFHSLSDLDDGDCATVSRVSSDNGIAGYYALPDRASIYPTGHLTVSTVSGDAFVQLHDFIATDNVIVCQPKQPLRETTLFFCAFMLNNEKWRYSYGRQCYITKFARVNIHLPVTDDASIDEDAIEQIVEQTSYWREVKTQFNHVV
jgi:hypothetical protein